MLMLCSVSELAHAKNESAMLCLLNSTKYANQLRLPFSTLNYLLIMSNGARCNVNTVEGLAVVKKVQVKKTIGSSNANVARHRGTCRVPRRFFAHS